MIAIKDFEMPKDCDSCPFYTYYNDACDDCRITGEEVQNVKPGERHPKCPLVNIVLAVGQGCGNKKETIRLNEVVGNMGKINI